MVGLTDRMEHYPNELSGGQQQRVAIARAIVTDPLLLIADEPTGDLDRTSAAEILEIAGSAEPELGKTIVMVTHDPRAAEAAHHLIYLDKGQLTGHQSVCALTEQPMLRVFFLKLVFRNVFRAKLRTCADDLGLVIATARVRPAADGGDAPGTPARTRHRRRG